MRLTTQALAWILTFLAAGQGLFVAGAGATWQAPLSDAARLERLERQLEALRQELQIPALSAAIVKDQKVLWAKGFGFADVENKVAATEHTPYHLASLTKTFASTILMQLVQEGKIKLDDPVSVWNHPGKRRDQVKHLLSILEGSRESTLQWESLC